MTAKTEQTMPSRRSRRRYAGVPIIQKRLIWVAVAVTTCISCIRLFSSFGPVTDMRRETDGLHSASPTGLRFVQGAGWWLELTNGGAGESFQVHARLFRACLRLSVGRTTDGPPSSGTFLQPPRCSSRQRCESPWFWWRLRGVLTSMSLIAGPTLIGILLRLCR